MRVKVLNGKDIVVTMGVKDAHHFLGIGRFIDGGGIDTETLGTVYRFEALLESAIEEIDTGEIVPLGKGDDNDKDRA